MKNINIIAGSQSIDLSKRVVDNLELKLDNYMFDRFSNGEDNIKIETDLTGQDVYIIQSTNTNDSWMELFSLIDCAKRKNPKSLEVIIPHFGYSRSDKNQKNKPTVAPMLVGFLDSLNVDKIYTIDIHNVNILNYFQKTKFENLESSNYFIEDIRNNFESLDDMVMVSLDKGGIKRAEYFAEKLGVKTAYLSKTRPSDNVSEVVGINGDVNKKTCILVDDMIDTAGTLVNGCEKIKQYGARKIISYATHGIFSGPAYNRINNSEIEKIISTNTIDKKYSSSKVELFDISKLISDVIKYN